MDIVPATPKGIAQAVRVLQAGGVVAFPTETSYGLAADATNPKAIRKVFALKGRGKKPVALIAGSMKQIEKYFTMNTMTRTLATRFWPGPLTIILTPKKAIAADALFGAAPARHSSGRPSFPAFAGTRRGKIGIGVRISNNPVARALARNFGKPITATSANRSGGKPCRSVAQIQRAFPASAHQPDILLNAGTLPKRKPSTVIATANGRITILRHGALSHAVR